MSYPTVAEIRGLEPDLGDPAVYSDTLITERRTVAIARIEDLLDRAFAPTTRTARVTVGSDCTLRLPRARAAQFRSWTSCTVKSPGASLITLDTAALWVTSAGVVRGRAWSEGDQVVAVYEHGDDACPPDVADQVAAYTRILCQQKRSGATPDRAERFALGDTGQVFALAIPGLTRLGYPTIDAALERYSLRTALA
jgi:hypothetical protein